MDQSLLLEVHVSDEPEPLPEKAKLLRLIRREAVEAGELDRFGVVSSPTCG